MRANQRLTANGAEIALFPMDVMNITQGRWNPKTGEGGFTHQGVDAYDLAGRDGGIDNVYAPFSLEVIWKDTSTKTGIVVHNTEYVALADGRTIAPKNLCMMLWHDDDIDDLQIGQKFAQGEIFYQEGNKGFSTGNHVHLELCTWKYDGGYPLFPVDTVVNGRAFKRWTLKGQAVNLEKCFYINDTRVISNKGYQFKTFEPKQSGPLPKLQVIGPKKEERQQMVTLKKDQDVINNLLNYGLIVDGKDARGNIVVKMSIPQAYIDKTYTMNT